MPQLTLTFGGSRSSIYILLEIKCSAFRKLQSPPISETPPLPNAKLVDGYNHGSYSSISARTTPKGGRGIMVDVSLFLSFYLFSHSTIMYIHLFIS